MTLKKDEVKKAIEVNLNRVLFMLETQGTVTNKEFLQAGIGRFGASIMLLRDRGYVIEKRKVPNSKGDVAYTLVTKVTAQPRKPATEKLMEILSKKGYSDVAENLLDILEEARVTIRNKPIY